MVPKDKSRVLLLITCVIQGIANHCSLQQAQETSSYPTTQYQVPARQPAAPTIVISRLRLSPGRKMRNQNFLAKLPGPSPGLFTVEVWSYYSILNKITNTDTSVKPRARQGSEPPFHSHPPSSTPSGLRHSPRILTFGSPEYTVQPSWQSTDAG